MSELTVLILCGRSPRHLYVANRLCRAARPLAIVHETGTQWTASKLAKKLKPSHLARKGWRWLRDRRRYVGGGEAKFFFGDSPAKLDRPDLVVEVPHVNDGRVVELAQRLKPDVIVAKSHGGEEYVHYFFGEHCYVPWKEQEQEAAKKDTVSP